jgi:hypothetical protein
MIHGIDVSAYQSANYDTTGLDFVFTKITEGLGYVNPRWAAQRDHAKSQGLVWGAYHYPHMANDPKAEADYFLSQVKWAAGDLIVLDWEGYDAANQNVPKARQIAYRDAWLKYVKGKMPSHRVGMYCNTDYWRNVDQTSNCGDFLWIATGGAAAGQPGIAFPWTFHQYSTANNVDHDVANFPNRAALAAWAADSPQEDDMPTADEIATAVLKKDGVIVVPGAPATNPTWTLSSVQTEILKRLDMVRASEAAQTAAIAKLASLIGSGVDTATVVAAVKEAIADAVVKVSVDVTGPQS